MKPYQRNVVQSVWLVAVLLGPGVSLACTKSTPAMTRLPFSPTPVPAPTPVPTVVPSGPTGSYTVTLTASPTCAVVTDWVSGETLPLPDSVRIRSYAGEFANGAATLSALDGSGSKIHIGGVDGYFYPGRALMFVRDGELTIIVPPANGSGFIRSAPTCTGGDYWWETLSNAPGDNEAFESCGTWRGSMENPERIDGTIDGSFGYYRGVGPNWRTVLFCTAPDHHFTLTRR